MERGSAQQSLVPRQGHLLCRSRSVFLPSGPSFLTTQQGCHRLVVPPMGDPQSVKEERWLRKNEGLPAETAASGTRVGQGDEHALANVSRRPETRHITPHRAYTGAPLFRRETRSKNHQEAKKSQGTRKTKWSASASPRPHALPTAICPPRYCKPFNRKLHQSPRPFSTCMCKRAPPRTRPQSKPTCFGSAKANCKGVRACTPPPRVTWSWFPGIITTGRVQVANRFMIGTSRSTLILLVLLL